MKEEHKNIPYRRPDETISLDELKSFLWGAATRLRGQIDAAGYKEYIFPLLFFKRISDVYDEQFEDFVAEGGVEYAGMQAAELAIRIPDGAHSRADVRQCCWNRPCCGGVRCQGHSSRHSPRLHDVSGRTIPARSHNAQEGDDLAAHRHLLRHSSIYDHDFRVDVQSDIVALKIVAMEYPVGKRK